MRKKPGKFQARTQYVKFLAKHIRCAGNMNQISSLVLIDERIHSRAPINVPLFDKNFLEATQRLCMP